MPAIEKRGPASWRIVEDSSGPDGKRAQKRKTIKVEDANLLKTTLKLQQHLNKELASFQMEVKSGEYIKPSKQSFKEFVYEWKKNYADQNMGKYTRRNYMSFHQLPSYSRIWTQGNERD